MKNPYSNFDLPRQHLSNDHYIPRRARNKDEIVRRRGLPTGTILAEQQRDGLYVASSIIENMKESDDLEFVTDMLSASILNAGWYSFAEKSDVMRRRLLLPELANDDKDWRESRSGLLTKIQLGLVETARTARELTIIKTERRDTGRGAFVLGRQLGNVSLKLACVQLGDVPRSISAFDAQVAAREQALIALERSRTAIESVGVNPSIAQLADTDSPLAFYWRRYAPDEAFDAYEQAIAEVSHAA